jgi:lysine N6-hydroxylase
MTSLPADLPTFHTIGIGAGPANLSLAALFEHATDERIALFDRQPGPYWHNQLLHSGVRMQTSWLKDLVSLVEPRHELTFVNYLVTTGRMYGLMNSQFDFIPRLEYVRYLAWAAQRLRDVRYGVDVRAVSFAEGTGFVVHAADGPVAVSEHLVLGVGSAPVMPEAFAGLPAEQVFLADDLADRLPAMAADRAAPVAVVGGGQTGLEATTQLLRRGFTDVRWFGRRLWFDTMDDSPCANDVYRPHHVQALLRLSPPTRRQVIERLEPTGDALTPGAMQRLYQENYDAMLQLGRFPVMLYPGRDVRGGSVAADPGGDRVVLDCAGVERREEHRVRHVVVATGRRNVPLPFAPELAERVETGDDGELVVDADYSVRWKGMNGHRIFALNRARLGHGLTDANLTLLPVRAAVVLNSLFGRELYEVHDSLSAVDWG